MYTKMSNGPLLCRADRSQPREMINAAEFGGLGRTRARHPNQLYEGVGGCNLIRIGVAVQRISANWRAPGRHFFSDPARKSAHFMPATQQARNQPPPHVARASRDEHTPAFFDHAQSLHPKILE